MGECYGSQHSYKATISDPIFSGWLTSDWPSAPGSCYGRLLQNEDKPIYHLHSLHVGIIFFSSCFSPIPSQMFASNRGQPFLEFRRTCPTRVQSIVEISRIRCNKSSQVYIRENNSATNFVEPNAFGLSLCMAF